MKKLKKENHITLTSHGLDIPNSYIEKSSNCFKAAQLLHENNLYENSISESYYAVYNYLLAILFRIGVKSQNHKGSIILFDVLFCLPRISSTISNLKEKRIDYQYYVAKDNDCESDSNNCLLEAKDVIKNLKSIFNNLNDDEIRKLRKKLEDV